MSSGAPEDLLGLIELSAVECLNQQAGNTIDNALKQGLREDSGLFLESDTDEQLLVHVIFQQAVKVHSICILGPDDGSGPKSVKLFINNPTLGFSEADDCPPAQDFELTESNLEGEPVTLRFVKFQNVNALTIFVEDNQGDMDTTKVSKIQIMGFSGEVMKVADIRKNQQQGG